MRKLFVVNFAAFVALGLLCSSALARMMETGDAAIARQAMPAVVNIATWKVHPATAPNGSPRRVKVYASGFVIDPSGIIVTNKHVVDCGLEMHVIFPNGDRAPVRLLAAAVAGSGVAEGRRVPAEGVVRAQAVQTMMIAQAPDPGIRLAPITEAARRQYDIDPKMTGVLVSSVESDCEARDLGIVPGDVITDVQGRPVVGPDDVRHAVQAVHEEHRPYLALLLQTKTGPRWVSLSISIDTGS